MIQFILFCLSSSILFGNLLAESSKNWDYLLGDWDFEIDQSEENEDLHHNTLESPRLSTKEDPKKPIAEEPNLALMTLEAPPASMVAGCVSAISGSFVDSHIGLVLPGALPLTVQCTYCSSEKKWSFKYKPKLRSGLSGGGNHINIGYVDDQGSGIPFRGCSSKSSSSFFVPPPVFEKGVTNCGGGEISGRTNLKNHKLEFIRNEWGKCFKLQTGNHSERIFSCLKEEERHRKGAPLGKFCLRKDVMPNGNQIKYGYNLDNKLLKVIAHSEERILGILEIEELSFQRTDWKSSWGKVSYTFDQKQVTRIDPTHSIPVSYKYNYENRIKTKVLPEGRYLEIDYYELHDSWHRKPVHRLYAPVGDNEEPVCIYTFTYDKNATADQHSTTVENAVGNQTVYTYGNVNKRLYSIKKVDGKSNYTYERFYWSVGGNLKARYFQGEDKIYFCRAYNYDNFGNVVDEWLWGNLTGKDETDIEVKKNGKPKNNCEVFTRKRTFTNDRWNLLLTEEDGRKSISCSYYPNSNLLKSRFTLDGSNVIKREFFEYDCGVLVREVWDDGKGLEQNDPSNVTERHEKRIALTSAGLPKEIAEYCNGKLFKKQLNIYSPQGHLTNQKHYGSDNCLAYTLYWDYDHLGNVIKEVNALGEVSCFTYDNNGNKTYEEGPRQELCKKYSYDFANRLTKEEEIWKDGRYFITSHRYNTLNQRTSTTDAYGHETFYSYDILGRQIEKRLPPVYDDKNKLVTPIEKTQYDPMGNIVAKWDANGHCTKRKCTIRGTPYYIEYPDGSHEEKYYTLDGFLECEIAKNGLIKTYTYDVLGRITTIETKSPDGKVLKKTTSTYNTFHLISEIDELGLVTVYTYDWAGRRSSMTKGDHVTYYSYDALGRNVKTVEMIDQVRARVTHKEYDLLDRIVEERIEDGETLLEKKQYCYDIHGNRTHLIAYTHAGQSIAKTTYLPNGEPLAIIDPLGNTILIDNNYSYIHKEQCVRCTTTTDPLGNQEIKIFDILQRVRCKLCKNSWGQITQSEEYDYDLAGHKIASHSIVYYPGKEPHTITTEWQYDCKGNVTRCIEAKGTKEQKTTHYKFNRFGQKILSELPSGIFLTYSYDDLGLLKTYFSSDGTISYSYGYDAKDHLVLVEDLVHDTSTNRNYDIYGRLISETLDHGQTITTAYDTLDRPISITLPDKSTIQYQYNALHLTDIHRGKYTHRYENYDLSGNVSLEYLAGQAGRVEYTYDLLERPVSTLSPYRNEILLAFDASGNLLNRCVGSLKFSYTYDDLYQLTSETGSQNHTYANDSIYNRRSKDSQIYTVNDLNQLLHQKEWDYHYDANGNLRLKSSDQEKVEFHYDALDRLIEVKNGPDITTYTYDSFHRRLSKTTNGISTYFLYYGQNEIGSFTNGKIDELRVLGLTRGAEIGSAVLFELQGQVFIPIHDTFGNVVSLLDPLGNLVESYNYSAFGEMDTLAIPTSPWLFSSKRLDPETGFFFFGRRYYATDIGRFITPDSLGFEDGPNLYTYAHNRPLVFIDPDGQLAWLAVPIASYLVSTAIGMAAEYYLPLAVASLGESAAGVACAAFLTGVVKGYNGSVLEGNSFDGAGWQASFCEYSGKAVGTALSCTSPKSVVNGGCKILANAATKEAAHLAEKALLQQGKQAIVSSMTKNTLNQAGKKTIAIAEKLEIGLAKGGSANALNTLGLKDGMKYSTSQALELGEQYLGKGYKEIISGSGRYVSRDGKRVFRMGPSDILGKHGGGPHVNFETLVPNPTDPSKMMVDRNLHIYLTD